MFKAHKKLGLVYLSADLLAAEAAFFSAVFLRWGTLYPIPPFFSDASYLFYALVLIVLYLPVLWAVGVRRERVPSVYAFFKALFVLAVLVNVLPFYFRGYAFSRLVVLLFCALLLVYGLLWRFFFQLLLGTSPGQGWIRERVLVVARADRVRGLLDTLRGDSARSFDIVGLVTDPSSQQLDSEIKPALPPVIGSLEMDPAFLQGREVDAVLIDPEGLKAERWLALAERVRSAHVGLRVLYGLDPALPLPIRPAAIEDAGEVDLLAEPICGFPALIKRTLDLTVSLAVLLLFSPLMAVVALAVKLASRGPVIYRQHRVGKNGAPFLIYKFRSMVDQAERGTGPVWATSDDRRIVPGIGHFIRRTGLDELPQFWNVLIGRMSLVGPRPERSFFFESFPQLYRGRLAVRPGLTGLAQVTCRASFSVEEKVRHDLFYIRNWSLALDVELLWRTLVMLAVQEWRALLCRPAEPDLKKDRPPEKKGRDSEQNTH